MAKEEKKLVEESKWLSRKWLMGFGSFILGTVFPLLDENDVIKVPDWLIWIYFGLAFTWLLQEGFLDQRALQYLERFGILKKK